MNTELQNSINALKGLSLVHRLLSEAQFKVTQLPAVEQALAFVAALHAQALEAAQAHPDAHTVPELNTQESANE